MGLLTFSILLACAALAVIGLAFRAQERATAARRASAGQELMTTGLDLSGDPLHAFTLRGEVVGLEMTLQAKTTAKLPGSSGIEREVCLVTFPVSMPDFVTCRLEDQDLIMGVLPSVPQLASGYSELDHRYVVFASGDERTGASGFRTGPEARALRWATGSTIQQLLDFQLQWARVQRGSCELALAPIRHRDAAGAIRLAWSFAAGDHTCRLVRSGGLGTAARPPQSLALEVWLGVAVPAFFVGFVLGFSSPLRDLNSEEMCGAGDHLVIVDNGDSTNVACAGNHGRDVDLHFASCGALGVALLFFVAAVRSILIVRNNALLEEK